MDDGDHLATEVAISAKLEKSAITAAARSRAVAAIDRLLGSAADIPTAYFENIAAKARLRGEIERRKLVADIGSGLTKKVSEDGRGYIGAKMEEEEAERLKNLSKVVNVSATNSKEINEVMVTPARSM